VLRSRILIRWATGALIAGQTCWSIIQ